MDSAPSADPNTNEIAKALCLFSSLIEIGHLFLNKLSCEMLIAK